jgi:hypothetical protein
MSGNDLTETANKMSIRRELSAGEERLKPRDNLVESL